MGKDFHSNINLPSSYKGIRHKLYMILVNVTWEEKGIKKESIGLDPRVAGVLMYRLERKGIKSKFMVSIG